MTTIEPGWAAAAAAATLAGVGLLYAAWLRKDASRALPILGGWGLILASIWPWAVAAGWDRGPAIAVCVAILAAFAIVARKFVLSSRHDGDASEETAARPAASGIPWARRTWVFMLAGPVAFIASALLGLAAFVGGPPAEADRLALSAYLVPFVWGALAAWAVADPSLVRKTAGIVGAGAAGGLALFILTATQA